MTQQSKTYAKLVAAIVLLLVLAGCASEPTLAPGTYTSTITRDDSTDYQFIGEWELTLAEDNSYSMSKDGRFHEDGTYTLSQDQIAFDQTSTTSYTCPATGTYQWAADGKTLTLTNVDDDCGARKLQLAMHPWSQQD